MATYYRIVFFPVKAGSKAHYLDRHEAPKPTADPGKSQLWIDKQSAINAWAEYVERHPSARELYAEWEPVTDKE